MLDAGRGNPNWIAASPREAFFLRLDNLRSLNQDEYGMKVT